MQFQVPQFIEIEDKIIGPLTLKQFFFLLGGAAGVFLIYAVLPLALVIFLAPPVAGFAAALAFHKVHGQPFIKVAENAFRHFMKAKIYTWRKREIPPPALKKVKKEGTGEDASPIVFIPKLTKSKLSDLAWSLDIKSADAKALADRQKTK